MEDRTNALNIRVHKFFTQADPVNDSTGRPTGEFKFVDYVEYGPPGEADKKTTVARMERILKARVPIENSNNPASKMDWEKAKYIEPLYTAWKKGEELPAEGTPLAACNFLRVEDLDVLKRNAIRTVEDLANLLDANLSSIKLPQMREKRIQARRMLEAQDANKAGAQLEAQAQKIKELEAHMLELMAQKAAPRISAAEAEEQAMNADLEAFPVDENGDRLPKKRKTLTVPQQAA